jgi:hypothetical protein
VVLIEREEVAEPDDYPSDPPLQYKPVPSLVTRAEFRYDKSDKNVFVFLYASHPTNHQGTMSFQVVYIY